MHIYPFQSEFIFGRQTPSPQIKHRYLVNHYPWQIDPTPSNQAEISGKNITPNKFHI